jgi:hypothetical protein
MSLGTNRQIEDALAAERRANLNAAAGLRQSILPACARFGIGFSVDRLLLAWPRRHALWQSHGILLFKWLTAKN